MTSYGSRLLLVTTLLLVLLVAAFGGAEQAASADLRGQRSAPLAATTRLVCKSGCSYSTVTAAVNASSSGDTIKVAQGTYNEVVHVYNKSLTILGGYSGSNWNVQNREGYKTIIKANTAAPTVKLAGPNGGTYTGTLDGFIITGGNHSGQGGGVYVSKYRATVSDNRLHHNESARGGGISVFEATSVIIQDNVIEDNTATADGGGIRVQDSSVSIIGNEILDNTATENGGGINVINGTVTIDDNTINGNRSLQLGGGGIMARSDSHCTIINNRIKLNRSVVGGGGVRIEDSDGTFEGNDVKRNTTTNIGGGLTVVRSHIDVEDNDFYYNVGQGGGGGVQFSTNSTGLIHNNRLVENEAGANPGGGGIHFWRCSPQFVDNTVTGNTADNAAGGVNIEDASPLVKENVIQDNHAGDHGGGISMCVDSTPTIIDNIISDNTASVMGGGIFGTSSAPAIRRNEIVDNQAPTAGGIHLAGSVGFEITNNIIARNRATVEGGGIHLTSNSRGDIVNNTLVNNNLGAGGEAINCRNTSRPRIVNNVMVGHSYGVRVKDQAAPTVDYNDVWQTTTPYQGVSGGSHSISCNPQFVNLGGGDYHLTAGSCVIDNGTASGAPTSDFDGDGRPLDGDGDGNAAWDRGADEYFNSVWVTKDVDTQVLDPGDWLSFTIVYRNNSGSTATGVVISDILSDDLTNTDYSYTGPELQEQGGDPYVWTVPGGLAPGAEGTIIITARASQSMSTPKAITNRVTFEMNGYAPFEDEVMIIVGGLTTHAPAVLKESSQ